MAGAPQRPISPQRKPIWGRGGPVVMEGVHWAVGRRQPDTCQKERALKTTLTKPDHGFAMIYQLYLYLKKKRRMKCDKKCSWNKTIYKNRQETIGRPQWKIPEEAGVPTRSLSRPRPGARDLIRSCLLKALVFCLLIQLWQDTGRTKPVLSDHRWSQPYSWIRAAMETRFAELTTANTEWMARSAPEIKVEGRRRLNSCFLDSFQELSWNSPIFQKLDWRIFS